MRPGEIQLAGKATHVPFAQQEPAASVTAASVVSLVRSGSTPSAIASEVAKLVSLSTEIGLPADWLRRTALALETNEWQQLAEPFAKLDFIGSKGRFLIVGPYTVRREASAFSELSAVYGEVIENCQVPLPLDIWLTRLFSKVNEKVTRIVPFHTVCAAGNLEMPHGEAFIVPDGWEFHHESHGGPALNNMSGQGERFERADKCIRSIFVKATADHLLSRLLDQNSREHYQFLEYQLHDIGHSAGLGLGRKLRGGLLPTWWHRAIEEWRADGVAFEIAARELPAEEASALVASNFCTRFGMDAHREGGIERDQDVGCSLLTLSMLLESGVLTIHDGKLSLEKALVNGLSNSVALHRRRAMDLTVGELELTFADGIHALYGGIFASNITRTIFNGLILEPCRGIHSGLR